MRLFDVSGCDVYIIRPGVNLSKWVQENNPFAVCNASLYNGIIPVGTIVEDYTYIHNDGNGYGFGVIDHKPSFGSPWAKQWDDYLTGYISPIQNGKYVEPSFNDGYVFGTPNTRIGIGEKDGKFMIITDDGVTLKGFADHGLANGVTTLVNLDGGLSRFLYYNGNYQYISARTPYNAIAFFKPGTAPLKKTYKYLDISMYQQNVDYELASKHVDGVILRAGYGKGNIDTHFNEHYVGFTKYGVPIGIYWFSYAASVDEATAEARYCLNAIKGKKISLPVCFDFEDDSVKNANKRGVTVTKSLATSMATAFLSEIEKNGYYAMLYTNPNFLSNYYGNVSRFDLWLAQYTSYPNPSIPPRSCGIWQYMVGRCKGFSGEVDLDSAFKDYAKIIRDGKLNHLDDTVDEPIIVAPTHPITPTMNGIEWATKNGILLKDESDVKATKGDIAQMIYEYHMIYSEEDSKQNSGLLGG